MRAGETELAQPDAPAQSRCSANGPIGIEIGEIIGQIEMPGGRALEVARRAQLLPASGREVHDALEALAAESRRRTVADLAAIDDIGARGAAASDEQRRSVEGSVQNLVDLVEEDEERVAGARPARSASMSTSSLLATRTIAGIRGEKQRRHSSARRQRLAVVNGLAAVALGPVLPSASMVRTAFSRCVTCSMRSRMANHSSRIVVVAVFVEIGSAVGEMHHLGVRPVVVFVDQMVPDDSAARRCARRRPAI